MKIKRALGFAIALYVVSFVAFFITLLLPGEFSLTEAPSLGTFVITWIINIPIVLLLAKWYFRTSIPTLKQGFFLGVFAILVALVLDGLSILATIAAGESLDTFASLYTDWKFYFTIFEIIALTTYAGYEFDGTYTTNGSEIEKS